MSSSSCTSRLGSAAKTAGRIGAAAIVMPTITAVRAIRFVPSASTMSRQPAETAAISATRFRSKRSANAPPSSAPAASARATAVITADTTSVEWVRS